MTAQLGESAKASKRQTARWASDARGRDRAMDKAAKLGEEDALAGRPADPPLGVSPEEEQAYQWGYDAALDAKKSSKNAAGRAGVKGGTTRPAATRRPARPRPSRRRKRPIRRAPASAARQVESAVAGQVTSGLAVLVWAASIAVLYNVLANADTAAGAISGAARAVRWLDSTQAIPYGGSS